MTQATDTADKLLNYGRRLLQPQYWPELQRVAIRKIRGARKDPRAAVEARVRCSAGAVDIATAMDRLGLSPVSARRFADDFPERLAAARSRVEAAGGRMGGGADIDLLYSLCRACEAAHVVETGVAFGWSSLAILSAIADRPGARLVSVDLPYLSGNMDDQVGLAVPPELRKYWSLRRGADRKQLPPGIATLGAIDLAHYDSDKSYEGRLWAYALIWNALRPGGLLVSDDIQDNFAFHDFADTVAARVTVVEAAHEKKFVGILRKPA